MTLPALATLDQLAVRLGLAAGELDDDARALAVLQDASVLVRNVTRRTWLNTEGTELLDVPDIVAMVVLSAAQRAYQNPQGITQKTAGDVSMSFAARGQASVYLTETEVAMLGQYSIGTSGLRTVATTRGELLGGSTIWVPTNGGPDFPWYTVEDMVP